MQCSGCGHENREAAKFCEECAAPLQQQCAGCGAVLRPTAKFCDECGAPIVESRLSKVESSHPTFDSSTLDSSTSPGERRQLTVLFCDLVGSTPLSQQLDAEEWRDLIAQYQQAAAGAVARFGGHVAKNLGDGLLIYFGWPTAREDDPERAIRAGLAIVEALVPLNATLTAGSQPNPLTPSSGPSSGPRIEGLAVRVGMHTGPVVIADGAAWTSSSSRPPGSAISISTCSTRISSSLIAACSTPRRDGFSKGTRR